MGDQRVATPTLSPDGALACAAVTSFDMDTQREHDRAVAVPDRARRQRTRREGAAAHRRRQGQRSAWSPDGRCDRVHREAQGRRRAADLPDRAGRRRGAAAHRRSPPAAASIKWFADGKRIAFVSWVWPDLATDAQQAKRQKERKDDKVKAHVTERAEFRFWDHWLTDGREPHVFVCDVASGRCRDVLAGTRSRAAAVGPDGGRLRHRARRQRDRAHVRSRAASRG